MKSSEAQSGPVDRHGHEIRIGDVLVTPRNEGQRYTVLKIYPGGELECGRPNGRQGTYYPGCNWSIVERDGKPFPPAANLARVLAMGVTVGPMRVTTYHWHGGEEVRVGDEFYSYGDGGLFRITDASRPTARRLMNGGRDVRSLDQFEPSRYELCARKALTPAVQEYVALTFGVLPPGDVDPGLCPRCKTTTCPWQGGYACNAERGAFEGKELQPRAKSRVLRIPGLLGLEEVTRAKVVVIEDEIWVMRETPGGKTRSVVLARGGDVRVLTLTAQQLKDASNQTILDLIGKLAAQLFAKPPAQGPGPAPNVSHSEWLRVFNEPMRRQLDPDELKRPDGGTGR